MDTNKFELTDEEIMELFKGIHRNQLPMTWFRYILQDQVDKVLSLLEPVELKTLPKIQINMLCAIDPIAKPQVLAKNVSRETIQHNLTKGQLYRMKEETK